MIGIYICTLYRCIYNLLYCNICKYQFNRWFLMKEQLSAAKDRLRPCYCIILRATSLTRHWKAAGFWWTHSLFGDCTSLTVTRNQRCGLNAERRDHFLIITMWRGREFLDREWYKSVECMHRLSVFRAASKSIPLCYMLSDIDQWLYVVILSSHKHILYRMT